MAPGDTGTSDVAADIPAVVGSLTITRVDVLQGTTATVWRDGSSPAARAPIIAGREALIRVFVQPAATFSPHSVTAHLTINKREFTATMNVGAPSTESTLATTFNFEVDAASVTPDSEVSVELKGESSRATAKLTAQTKSELLLVIVPFRYRADGSNRVPDTSEPAIKSLTDGIAAMFPVSALTTTISAPVDLSTPLLAKGAGWNEWLTGVYSLKKAGTAKTSAIYVGIATPAESGKAYCSAGCVTSLAPNPTVASPEELGLVIAQFPDSAADDTTGLAYALGATLGRKQVGCSGMSGADMMYPHEGGTLGVPGYDRRSKKLIDVTHNDVMTYCSPKWISDYTFTAIAKRIVEVNAL